MHESELLKHIYANATNDPRVLLGPGDDMAMVQMEGSRLLAAVDQLIDGRHVRLSSTPLHLVGRKAVARSVSDIAAMACKPLATLVAAALPPDFGAQRANELFDAMRRAADEFECPLIGGDIAVHARGDSPLVCAVTVLAQPGPAGAITRAGAQPGDLVYVTGPLGGSLLPDGLGRHLTFEPRIALALQLAEALGDRLHAMIDISDGLGRDASHIAEMSHVQLVLQAAAIPRNAGCDWKRALSDGEDYELCFTAAPPVPEVIAGCKLHRIGEVRSASQHTAFVQHGDQVTNVGEFGWQHRGA